MLDRAKRLKEVYKYLYDNFGVHAKGEFAESIGYARSYISSAINGNERYLTDSLFKSICKTYDNVFNLEYLLTGEGSLTTPQEDARRSGNSNSSIAIANLQKSMDSIVDMQRIALSALERQNEVVRNLYESQLTEKQAVIDEKSHRIALLEETIRLKDSQLSALREQVESLTEQLSRQQIPVYPFKPGVAESNQEKL